MRKLLYILVFLLTLSFVMSCGRGVDKRLVLADTLMWTNPDSSLAILEKIDSKSLKGKENQAYNALLLTQAQFRVDYAIPTDSLINIALNHYNDNHNREHYTRTLLYKGAYYEVHDNPVEAIKWYKKAEDNADTADYRNLAQINMRMGMLYYNNYASNNLDFEKLKKALVYYKRINDKHMIMQSLGYVGNLYRETDNKKAISCLIEAKDIAHELKDTTGYYLQLSDLSMAYYLDSLYVEAKDAAVECVNSYQPNNNMFFNAANAYAALNMPDSARFFLDKVGSTNLSDYDRMMILFAKGYISKAEGDEIQALRFERLANAISDTIKANSKRNEILETEELMNSVFDNGKKANKITVSTMMYVVVVGLIIFLLVVSVLSYIVINKHFRYKRLHNAIQQNQALIENLIEDNKRNINKLKSTKEQNESLKQQYISQIRITDYLNNYFNSFNYLLQKSKKLSHEKFVEEFKQTVAVASQDERFWDIISILANKKSNSLVTELQKRHPSLTDTDIKILNLICLGYKNDAIAACTGLEKGSVKSTKTTIKNKIGAPINLEAFITITSHNSSNL